MYGILTQWTCFKTFSKKKSNTSDTPFCCFIQYSFISDRYFGNTTHIY